jgi:DNA-binding response OmpR family regulator/HPt (histidine-containing phosphotransfer) domain-containing protein
MRLLLIDDDEPFMESLARQLTRYRFAVDTALDGESAKAYVSLFHYDVLLLDVSLPDISGITLCQQLRTQGCTIPILFLTGRDRSTDKVEGLNAGADDYVVKPVDLNELIARIYALLRRESHNLPTILQWGSLTLDPSTFEATYNHQLLNLTPKELGILELFLRAPNHIRSPAAIIESLWANEDPPSEEVVRTHMKGLRQKLKAAGAPKDLIETVYGLGYRLNKQWELTAQNQELPQQVALPAMSTAQDNALTQLWQTYKPLMISRVEGLEAVIRAARKGQLTPESRKLAASDAHKLVGSLGSFGFGSGSALARQMEDLLKPSTPLSPEQVAQLATWVQTLRLTLDQSPSLVSFPTCPHFQITILLLGDDASPFVTQLQQQAMKENVSLITYPFPLPCDWLAQIETQFTQMQQPELCCLILNEALFNPALPQTEGNPSGSDILAQLRQHFSSQAILALLPKGDLAERLQVVRQGADRVMLPLEAAQVIAVVRQLLRSRVHHHHIFLVDDDPVFLAGLETQLMPWPFEIQSFTSAAAFWVVLEQSPPDLLVLDIEMPDASGLELCQVLRSDPQWSQLPILFLTHHQDLETQLQAYACGGDDLVIKPVQAEELANRILNRLQRVHPPAPLNH